MNQENKIIGTLKVAVLALLVSVGASYLFAAAPGNPTGCPSTQAGCNIPIHTASTTQTKIGNLFSTDTIFGAIGTFTKLGVGNLEPVAELDISGDVHATQDICTSRSGGVCLSSIQEQNKDGVQFIESPTSYTFAPSSVTTVTLGSEVPAGTNAVLVSASVSEDARLYFYTMDNVFTGGIGGRVGSGESVASAGGQLIIPLDPNKSFKYRLTQGKGSIVVLGPVSASPRPAMTASCTHNVPAGYSVYKNTNVVWSATVNNPPVTPTFTWKATGMSSAESTDTYNGFVKSFSTNGTKVMTMNVTAGTANLTITCSPNLVVNGTQPR